jgi:hypothetical protein
MNPRPPLAPWEATTDAIPGRSILSWMFPPLPPLRIEYQHFPHPFFLLHPPTGEQVIPSPPSSGCSYFLPPPSGACSYFSSQPVASTDLVASLTSLNLDHQGNLTGLCKKRKESCNTPTPKKWQGPTIEVRVESICNPSSKFLWFSLLLWDQWVCCTFQCSFRGLVKWKKVLVTQLKRWWSVWKSWRDCWDFFWRCCCLQD